MAVLLKVQRLFSFCCGWIVPFEWGLEASNDRVLVLNTAMNALCFLAIITWHRGSIVVQLSSWFHPLVHGEAFACDLIRTCFKSLGRGVPYFLDQRPPLVILLDFGVSWYSAAWTARPCFLGCKHSIFVVQTEYHFAGGDI